MRRWLLALVLFLSGACTVPIGRLDAVAVSASPPSSVAVGAASGRDCRWWVLGIPLGLPRIDTATEAALAETGARELRDVEVTSDHPAYGLVGRHCYAVRGTAWR